MLNQVRLRLAQVVHYLRPGSIDITPWLAHLTPEAMAVFAILPVGDQRHAVAVARSLQDRGASPMLVTAGLLHDIGKAVPGTAVSLPDRVTKVFLSRFAPNQLAQMAASQAPRWPLGGVWVLSRHALHGGDLLRGWGYPKRVAWLVEHHEDRVVADPQLALLMAVDDGRDARTFA